MIIDKDNSIPEDERDGDDDEDVNEDNESGFEVKLLIYCWLIDRELFWTT